jgi:D-arabinose 1-dehydrogenase-like Zn-dependent alcohol dehydrogenase
MATGSVIEPQTSEAPPTSYRAAVVHDFESPLTVEQVPMPELGPGQVRVKVEACGLCHTDLHAASGDWPIKPSPPFIPGHEGVGLVTQTGPGVSEVAVGTASRCRGSATRAATVTTACRAGRRFASRRR